MPERSSIYELVPEYRSRNPAVRWIFNKRFEAASRMARLEGAGVLEILDLGCGEGAFMKYLRALHPAHKITGMDIHPEVERLSVPGAGFRQADLTRPGALPPSAFDRIFCFEVLEHIRELAQPLRSISEALKPGGLLVVSAPTENIFYKACRFLIKGTFSEAEGPGAGPHYWTARGLAREIAGRGFRKIDGASLPVPGPFTLAQVSVFERS